MGYAQPACHPGTHIFLVLTAVFLQILSNLSNEMGDYRSGVDNADRQGPAYGMADGLTEKQLWCAINTMVVLCAVSGLTMVWLSGSPWWLLLLGAAAIWAATHYTLGKKPYGYIGLGDLFVFIFFGLVSVLGSHYVIAHNLFITSPICTFAPAVGVGLLSVAVLNVNNIRDMKSDAATRVTVAIRMGERRARIYQTVLIAAGWVLMTVFVLTLPVRPWYFLYFVTLPLYIKHLRGVWTLKDKQLDPMLPLLVIGTFLFSLIGGIGLLL